MLPSKVLWVAAGVSVALHGAALAIALMDRSDPRPAAAMAASLAVEVVAELPAETAPAAPNPMPLPAAAPIVQMPMAAERPSPPQQAKKHEAAAHRTKKRQKPVVVKAAGADAAVPPPASPTEPPTRPAEAPATILAAVTTAPPPGGADTAAPPADAASPARAASASSSSADADYLRAVVAWLERHKTYPEQARARREEGTVLIAFSIDRRGHVVSFAIRRSSGFAVLDSAAQEMVDRADPLPPVPDSYGRDRLALTLPVEFALQ